MRALTLIVRNLDASAPTEARTRCPALESFLSRCDITVSRQESVIGWACAAHGIERQQDWPAGAILACDDDVRKETHGGDGAQYWLCAQPVHLAVDRNSLILQPPSRLRLSAHESRQLFDALKPYFDLEQLDFRRAATEIWCIGTRHHQNLSTTEPELAQGRDVDGLQPVGTDAAWWQRLMTEAQMILHQHPVNAAREARGELPVNSVWLWGGGFSTPVGSRFDLFCAEDPVLRALARQSGAQLIDAPASYQTCPDARNVLVDFTLQPDGSGDASLPSLEAHWLSSAWQGLADAQLDELTLVLPLSDRVVLGRCARRARRRFWRRRQSVAAFIARLAQSGPRS